ncbi:MAG: hypothetical protein K5663_10395 [Clostridiales bacterium]|nr:hypothetical protein [Clostridiales bacterium]
MNKKDVFRLLVILAVIVLAVLLVNRIGASQEKAETEIVREAIKNAALTCYAVEGAYPDSLDYLRQHYRLAYDEERYLVTYDAFASNLIPTVYVMERGETMP